MGGADGDLVAGGTDTEQPIGIAGGTTQLAIPVDAREQIDPAEIDISHLVFQLPVAMTEGSGTGEGSEAGEVIGGGHINAAEIGELVHQALAGGAGGEVTAIDQ